MAKLEAKTKLPSFKIEALVNGEWLWVVMPRFEDRAEADAAALRMDERSAGLSHRVVED